MSKMPFGDHRMLHSWPSITMSRCPYSLVLNYLQRSPSSLLQGFKDDDLENSPGWQPATVTTYFPSRPSQLLATTVTKHYNRLDENRCLSHMFELLA